MNRPYLSKENKKKTTVTVPNDDRERLKAEAEKQKVIDSLTRALNEVRLMEEGKMPKPNINDLFKD
ncbi:hypothetical protein DYBT9623_01630 [Dyadobacter sp. CECT 9623]|uniref:Uncharacterized protein n=1 Tax=Dyadobacter linearis TaxID=2823330 RepID=A0ABN7RBP3_9BACT|nr:hypothetical protein [Dyadobacter sp. CECT 9623]CAG5068898.1 hypothetical protein DYBT9623_01630 [Dyadobacter sp. CECT 9623]